LVAVADDPRLARIRHGGTLAETARVGFRTVCSRLHEALALTALVGGLLAAACFTAALLASTRSARMIGAGPTLGGVMLFGLALAVPIAALTVGDTRPTAAQVPYLLIAGLGNVLGLGCEYIALRTGKVGVVGALAASEGAIAAVLAVIAGESLAGVETIGVAVVGFGVIMASLGRDPDTVDPRAATRAIVFGGLAGLAFGASLYATGRIGADLAAGWAVLPPRIVGVILITIPLAATGRFRVTRAALPFIVVAGAGEVGGFLAVGWGASESIAVTSALAAQFATAAAIIAWLALGERLGRVQWIGIAAVAVGVVFLALGAA
jgi:drug/metabolite transporter (DMT)-like permease